MAKGGVKYPSPWTTGGKPKGGPYRRRAFGSSPNKYKNTKVKLNGEEFDSVKEFNRYCFLQGELKKGAISDLRRQVKFPLVPAQFAKTDEVYQQGPRKGQQKRGKCLERAVDYIADFTYRRKKEDGTEEIVIEDVKGGIRTDDYIIKRKLMLWIHGIQITEV